MGRPEIIIKPLPNVCRSNKNLNIPWTKDSCWSCFSSVPTPASIRPLRCLSRLRVTIFMATRATWRWTMRMTNRERERVLYGGPWAWSSSCPSPSISTSFSRHFNKLHMSHVAIFSPLFPRCSLGGSHILCGFQNGYLEFIMGFVTSPNLYLFNVAYSLDGWGTK